MTKIARLIAFFLLLLSFARAQNKITGRITDNKNTGLPGVSVLLLTAKDSSLVKGGISDEKGAYSLSDIRNGLYLLKFNSTGFTAIYKSMELSSTVEMPDIKMEIESKELEQAVVVAEKPLYEQKFDRVVINVQKSVTSAGGTALEVLERSPGVQVNRVNNSISLNGKDDVLVMINGKVSRQSISSLMQLLNGMSAANIEKIELIPNPAAKYEAGSNGGIINIQMAQNSDIGTNGSVTANAGYGKHEKAGLSLNLNHRTEKANIYADLSYNRDHTYQYVINNRVVYTPPETINSRLVDNRDPVSTNFNGRVGIDYTIDKKTSIGSFISGYSNLWDMTSGTSSISTSNINPSSSADITTHERGRLKNIIANLNISHQISAGSSWDFNADYLYYGDRNTTTYNELSTTENVAGADTDFVKTTKVTPMNIFVISLDYTTMLSKRIKLETGVKGISSKLDNDVVYTSLLDGVYIPDSIFTNNSMLNEQIGAVYGSATYKMDDKTNVNIGLRYEYSQTTLDQDGKGQIANYNDSRLYPTVLVSRKLSDKVGMELFYGKRITRPSFSDLAPFFTFLDPSTYFVGNISLRPAINDNVKLGMNYKKYLFAVEYTHEANAISRFQPMVLAGTDQQVFTSLNLAYRNTLSLMFTLPIRVTSQWNMNLNMIGFNRKLATKENEVLKENYYTINVSQNYQFLTNYTFEVTGFYNSESLDGISKTGAYYNLNMGLRKRFNNDSQLSLAVNNMFKFQNNVYSINSVAQDYATNTLYKFETWKFRLSYLVKFGNSKLKDKKSRATGAEEIQTRVN
jgi:hypothetical protein